MYLKHFKRCQVYILWHFAYYSLAKSTNGIVEALHLRASISSNTMVQFNASFGGVEEAFHGFGVQSFRRAYSKVFFLACNAILFVYKPNRALLNTEEGQIEAEEKMATLKLQLRQRSQQVD